jgi:hypothetical protein
MHQGHHENSMTGISGSWRRVVVRRLHRKIDFLFEKCSLRKH